MPSQDELWHLLTGKQQGVLATTKRDQSPQLSNVLYTVDTDTRLLRISTTADRAKARNLTRNPRACLHVMGEDFWQYAVAEGTATISALSTTPGDETGRELYAVHSPFYGELDPDTFYDDMVANKRLVIRLDVQHLYGVITTTGRRPVADNSLPNT